MRARLSAWLPPIVWMCCIFAASGDLMSAEHTSRFLVPFLRWWNPTISDASIATIHFLIRKLGHLTEYAILATLLWRALRAMLPNPSSSAVAVTALFGAAVFAASDEFHQSFVATRTASAHDVMIDCIGAAAGITLCALAASRRRRVREKEWA